MQPGELIRMRRKRRGMSQEELAGLLDCSQVQISRWERGVIGLTLEDLRMIGGVLDFTPEDRATLWPMSADEQVA